MTLRKGIAMWISGSLTFLAALNTFNAIMLWAYHGADSVIDPYFNILRMGGIQVTDYFLASLIATFSFLGLTSLIAYGRSSPYQALTKRIGQLENGLGDTQRKIEDANSELAAKLEIDSIKRHQLSDAINTKIDNATKEMLNTIDKHGKFLRRNREDLSSSVKRSLNNMTEEMMGMLEKRAEAIQKNLLSTTEAHFCNIRNDIKMMLEKQGKALQAAERSGDQTGEALQRQMAKLEYVEAELEALRIELTLPKPRLNSLKGPEEINGIGPLLGTELRSIGITNIGELINVDPLIIAEKTPISLDMAKRFQARAQLLMIPGVDEIDAQLLEDLGIWSRRELANQNSIHLSRRIAEVAKSYVEKGKIARSECPTIEEVSSWIKYASP
jgi:hypothetical protein